MFASLEILIHVGFSSSLLYSTSHYIFKISETGSCSVALVGRELVMAFSVCAVSGLQCFTIPRSLLWPHSAPLGASPALHCILCVCTFQVYMFVCVQVCICGQRLCWVFSSFILHWISWDRVFHLVRRSFICPDWLASGFQRSSHLCLSSTDICYIYYIYVLPLCLAFYVLSIQLRTSCLHSKYFPGWTISPAYLLLILKLISAL